VLAVVVVIKRKSAFTLVELLVVVAIVAVVAAIVLPVVSGTKRVAYSTADRSNLRQIGLARNLYMSETNVEPESVLPLINSGMISKEIVRSSFDVRQPDTRAAALDLGCRGLPFYRKYFASTEFPVSYVSMREVLCEPIDQAPKFLDSPGWLIAFPNDPERSYDQAASNLQNYRGNLLRLDRDGSVKTRSFTFHSDSHATLDIFTKP
jgi:prepilin-type N-terminal cleavage/methylation domain-containing protein